MRILLIYPPNDLMVGEKQLNHVIDTCQPLGLSYIAAVLEKAGYEVRIVDAKVEALSINEILNKISDFKPRIVGLTSSTSDFCVTRFLAKQIKSFGDYITIIGGAHVSALPEETIEDGCFDYGVLGEGERTIVKLADAISHGNKKEVYNIRGIIFRNGSRIVRTSPQDYIEDLDTIPFPARYLLPPFGSYPYFFYYKSLPVATIVTSRGCPYQCSFCDRAVFGNKLRMRSAGNILDEIEMLVKKYSIRGINIMDDLFTLDPERVIEFCQQLISRKLKVAWSCFSRVDSVNIDMLKTMKKAGCWMIGYGIESGNQRILDGIKKNVSLEVIRKTVELTNRIGILVFGNFILGLPGENETTMRYTLEFAKKLPLYRAIFHIAQPFPGSELYKMALAKGEIKKDIEYRYYHFYCFTEKLPYVADGLSVDILKKYLKKAYRDFYLRPSYIFRRIFKYREFKGFLKRTVSLLRDIF